MVLGIPRSLRLEYRVNRQVHVTISIGEVEVEGMEVCRKEKGRYGQLVERSGFVGADLKSVSWDLGGTPPPTTRIQKF